MKQDQVSSINLVEHNNSLINNGVFDEDMIDIRRIIEQYHNPIAYYISFGLDRAGIRLVKILTFKLNSTKMSMINFLDNYLICVENKNNMTQ